jgi:hypothetical protein
VQLFAPVIAPWLLEQLEIFVYVLKNQHPTGVVYVQLRSIFADQSQTFLCVHPTGKEEKKEESCISSACLPRRTKSGGAQEKEASTEHYRSCYQLRMLKNIDVSILASDVGKLDFAGAGHLLRCCAQSRVF